MGKTFKNLVLQNRGCLMAEPLHGLWLNLYIYHQKQEVYQSCWNNGLTLTFDLFTVRSILLPYAFVWEKCSEFQTTSPPEPLGQFCSNFIWSLLRLGEWEIAKMVGARWPRWLPCPYMVKTFKNLLLQNRGCLGAESLHVIGDGRSTKIAKIRVVYWHLTFLRQGQVCFPMHLYGKNL